MLIFIFFGRFYICVEIEDFMLNFIVWMKEERISCFKDFFLVKLNILVMFIWDLFIVFFFI